MKIPENVKVAIDKMFSCKNMMEHLSWYQHYINELEDCTFIVFSENEGTKLPNSLCTDYNGDFAVVNIGCSDYYYAINKKICQEMLAVGKSDYYVDLCVELDTQAISYLKNTFGENGQILNYDKNKSLINYLNLQDVDYSCIPYMVENSIKKGEIKEDDCKSNLKSFVYLKYLNYHSFLQNGIFDYGMRDEDIQLEANELYSIMFSEEFRQCYEHIFDMQRAVYILLVKASCIELINSHKSARNKMMELFDFVNKELGFLAERELEVCYYFF